VRRVFSGVAPAPETPGTVESMVLPRTRAIIGRCGRTPGSSERNRLDIVQDGRRE
jgi:hypothetical protein